MLRVILAVSLLGSGAALAVPGQSDWLLLTAPCAVACLFLLLRRAPHSRKTEERVIIDGSNVMHWADGAPSLDPVRAVVAEVSRRGLTPGVIFDANVGYKIGDRYQDDQELARKLGLPEAQVLVVPKGTPADDYILRAARDLGATVVSNDRYRDWAALHPKVNDPGYLLRGQVRGKRAELWVDA